RLTRAPKSKFWAARIEWWGPIQVSGSQKAKEEMLAQLEFDKPEFSQDKPAWASKFNFNPGGENFIDRTLDWNNSVVAIGMQAGAQKKAGPNVKAPPKPGSK